MTFRIKDIREKKGMTQEELSEKSDVSRGTIAALESGKAVVTTTKTLEKISSALDCRIDEIFFADCVQSAEQNA